MALADTLGVLEDELVRRPLASDAQADALTAALAGFREALAPALEQRTHTVGKAERRLAQLMAHAEAIVATWPAALAPVDGQRHWPAALLEGCLGAHAELLFFLPDLLARNGAGADESGAPIPSLRALHAHAPQSPAGLRARERIHQLERLAHLTGQFSLMEYGFLYDRARHLLAIGYNLDEHRLDAGYYDLLASEARLCTFVGIAGASCRRRAGSRWAGC